MSQLNDLQYSSLEEKGYTGVFNNKEYAWLFDQGCTIQQLNDRWKCYLDSLGYTGSYNDKLFEYLGDKGCTQGTLQDRWSCALKGGSFYGDALPAFHAATYDDTTLEALVQKIGVGTPTTTHTATIYALDHEGVYRDFLTDEPVWEGGRVVRNYAKHSEDLTQHGISNGLIINDSTTVTLPAGGIGRLQLSNNAAVKIDETWICTFDIQVLSGVVNKPPRVLFASGSNISNGITNISTTRQRYSITDEIAVDATSSFSLYPAYQNTEELEIMITHISIENATGRSDTETPSEYIQTTTAPVTEVFANENGNTVLNNVVTEGVGAALTEQPMLVSSLAATNELLWSYDLTQWNTTNQDPSDSVTCDQIGLTSAPDTATLLHKDGAAGNTFRVTAQTTGTIVGDKIIWAFYVKKDLTHTTYSRFLFNPSSVCTFTFQPSSGVFVWGANPGDQYYVEDQNDRWALFVEYTSNGTYSDHQLYPAGGLSDGGSDYTQNGDILILNVEQYRNKTIEQVKALPGPIFTEGTAESIDAHIPKYDALNKSDSLGPYVFEFDWKGNDTKVLGEFLYVEDGGSVTENSNSDFSLWADPTVPDDWVKSGTHNATNYIEEVGSQGLRLVSDGTLVGVKADFISTVGVVYVIEYKYTDKTSGGAKIWNIELTGSSGVDSFQLIESNYADSTLLRNAGVTDVSFDYFRIKEIDGKYLKLTDGTTILQHPTALTEGKHQCAVSMEVGGEMDLALDGSWAYQDPRGAELVTDGGFDTACGVNWTCQTGWNIGSGTAICDGTSAVMIYQASAGLGSKISIVEFDVTAYTAGSLQLRVGTTAGPESADNGVGHYREIVTGTGYNYIGIFSINFLGSIDNISVKELTEPYYLDVDGNILEGLPYDGTLPISTDLEQGITGNELTRFDIADLEEQKAKADEEMA